MSRLPLVGPKDLDAEQKAFWEYIVNGPRGASLREPLKSLPGPFNPWMQVPSFGRVAAEMGERLRFRSVLPGKLRELAILTTGAHWKAEFEFWAHARAARAEGLPDSVIAALQAGTAVPYEDDLQRLVHNAAKDLVETGRLRTDLVEQLANALGWPAVVELVALVGFYCMVSFSSTPSMSSFRTASLQSGAAKVSRLSWTRPAAASTLTRPSPAQQPR